MSGDPGIRTELPPEPRRHVKATKILAAIAAVAALLALGGVGFLIGTRHSTTAAPATLEPTATPSAVYCEDPAVVDNPPAGCIQENGGIYTPAPVVSCIDGATVFAAIDNIKHNEPIAHYDIQNYYIMETADALYTLFQDWKSIADATEADPAISAPARESAKYFRLAAYQYHSGTINRGSQYWNAADASANAYEVQAAVSASSLPPC
jgi:hypothetical protein